MGFFSLYSIRAPRGVVVDASFFFSGFGLFRFGLVWFGFVFMT